MKIKIKHIAPNLQHQTLLFMYAVMNFIVAIVDLSTFCLQIWVIAKIDTPKSVYFFNMAT